MSDDVRPVRDALCGVHNAIVDYIAIYNNQPSIESKAITELGDSRYHKAVANAYSQSDVQLVMACDQVIGLSRALAEPMLTIAPWVCVRAILELTAVASWLVDPAIGAKERAARSYALRFEGLRQQKKFADAAGAVADAAAVVSGMNRLATEGGAIGLQRLTDDKGKLSGIGEHFKQFTTLTQMMLDEEANYRLFSAMTHGHLWAASQLGFRINAVGAGSPLAVSDALPIEQGMPGLAPAYLCLIASKTLVTFMGYKALLFGWDERRLKEFVSPHLAKLAAGAPSASAAGT